MYIFQWEPNRCCGHQHPSVVQTRVRIVGANCQHFRPTDKNRLKHPVDIVFTQLPPWIDSDALDLSLWGDVIVQVDQHNCVVFLANVLFAKIKLTEKD